MNVRVAVRDPLPLFQQGVVAALSDADVDVDIPPDVLGWLAQGVGHVVILTLSDEADWDLLMAIRRRDAGVPVIALLDDTATAGSVAAVGRGATSVLARDAPAAMLRWTLWTTLSGGAVVPARVLRSLVERAVLDDAEPPPPAEALSWLRGLAGGLTVAALADQAGYSERAMFRLLRDLYSRLGVGGRTEALMLAQQRGWLTPGSPPSTGPADRVPAE